MTNTDCASSASLQAILAANLPPDSYIELDTPLPSMSVILVPKSVTTDISSSRNDPSSRVIPGDPSYLPPMTAFEEGISNNSHFRFLTNNAWSTIHRDVVGAVDDVNRICAKPCKTQDIAQFVHLLVNKNGTLNGESKISAHCKVASPEMAEELVKKRLVWPLEEARRTLPLAVRRMMSENPTIAVSADEQGVHLFTNKDPTVLSQPSYAELVQSVQDQFSSPSGYQPDDQCTDQERHFNGRAQDMCGVGLDHGQYAFVAIDKSAHHTFLSGDCAGIWPLTEADLSKAHSTHINATRGSDLEGVGSNTSGLPTQLGKRKKVRRVLSKFGSSLKPKKNQ